MVVARLSLLSIFAGFIFFTHVGCKKINDQSLIEPQKNSDVDDELVAPIDDSDLDGDKNAPDETLLTGKPIDLYFNEPGAFGAESSFIEDKIIQHISLAEPGSEIRMSIYHFYRAPAAIALLEAHAKGVDVKIVFGSDNDDKEGFQIITQGYADLPGIPASNIQVCISSCFGNDGINHNKYILFSKLADGREKVLLQTSANFTNSQLKMFNDLVVINRDAELYESFKTFWEKQFSKIIANGDQGGFTSGTGTQVYYFPRPNGSDTIIDILNRVTCLSESKIYLAQSRFRRIEVAEKLNELATLGCGVTFIARNESVRGYPRKEIRDVLGENLLLMPYQEPDKIYNSIHTKLLLIDAGFDNSNERRQIVLTGSHNLNYNSLTVNDEVLLKFEDATVFTSYLTFWKGIRKAFDDYLIGGVVAQPNQ